MSLKIWVVHMSWLSPHQHKHTYSTHAEHPSLLKGLSYPRFQFPDLTNDTRELTCKLLTPPALMSFLLQLFIHQVSYPIEYFCVISVWSAFGILELHFICSFSSTMALLWATGDLSDMGETMDWKNSTFLLIFLFLLLKRRMAIEDNTGIGDKRVCLQQPKMANGSWSAANSYHLIDPVIDQWSYKVSRGSLNLYEEDSNTLLLNWNIKDKYKLILTGLWIGCMSWHSESNEQIIFMLWLLDMEMSSLIKTSVWCLFSHNRHSIRK